MTEMNLRQQCYLITFELLANDHIEALNKLWRRQKEKEEGREEERKRKEKETDDGL